MSLARLLLVAQLLAVGSLVLAPVGNAQDSLGDVIVVYESDYDPTAWTHEVLYSHEAVRADLHMLRPILAGVLAGTLDRLEACVSEEQSYVMLSGPVDGSFVASDTTQQAYVVSVYGCGLGDGPQWLHGLQNLLVIVADGAVVATDWAFPYWVSSYAAPRLRPVALDHPGRDALLATAFASRQGHTVESAVLVRVGPDGHIATEDLGDVHVGSCGTGLPFASTYVDTTISYRRPADGSAPALEFTRATHSCDGRPLDEALALRELYTRFDQDPTLIFSLARDASEVAVDMIVTHHYAADLASTDAFGQTPLMYAAGQNSLEVVRTLLRAGADPDATTFSGWNALMYAIRDNADISIAFELLLRTSELTRRTSDGWTAAELAREHGRQQVADRLDLEVAQRAGTSPLFSAIASDDAESVRAVLRSGADPDSRDAAGLTPLMVAARDAESPDVVLALLEAGADASLVASEHPYWSAQRYARANTHLECTEAPLHVLMAHLHREARDIPPLPIGAPTLVTPGRAPFIPPERVPARLGLTLYAGTASLEGRIEERHASGNDGVEIGVDLTVTVFALRLPLKLDGRDLVAVITYVDTYEMDLHGGLEELPGLGSSLAGEVDVEVRELTDGALGDLIVAVGADRATGRALQEIGFVPLGSLALARVLQAGQHEPIGQGATLSLLETATIDGVTFTIARRDAVSSVTEREVRFGSLETLRLHPFTHYIGTDAMTVEITQEIHTDTVLRSGTEGPSVEVEGRMALSASFLFEVVASGGRDVAEAGMDLHGPLRMVGYDVSGDATPAQLCSVLRRSARLVAGRLL